MSANQAKKKIEEKTMHTFWKSMLLPSGIFIGILLIALFLIGPTKTFFYTVEVPYETQEEYTEQEPYQTQESYQVQEPYQTTETFYDQVPFTEQQVSNAPEGQYYPSCGANCGCTKWGGFFYSQCMQCTCDVVVYKTVQKERPVTKYNQVTKTRTVTAYRDIVKTRTVTKIRQEERQYEQNWVFGFRVPWFWHMPYLSYQPGQVK